ncbi:MAG: hypothetical protein Kow00117_21680 [Phototrophicales bacterium]
MSHVLIAYLDEDSEFAQQTQTILTNSNLQVDMLPVPSDWKPSIDNAIGRAFAVVVILSPTALHHNTMTYIWAFALGIGVSVVPVVSKAVTIPRRLRALRCLDFSTPQNRIWEDLIELLHDVQAHYQPDHVRISQEMQTVVDPETNSKIQAHLIFHESAEPTIYEMTQSVITVGRDTTNDLVLDHPEISRHHVRFTYTIEGFTIEDLGSRNGTFINDQQLAGVQLLRHGDIIRLGDAITAQYGIKEI